MWDAQYVSRCFVLSYVTLISLLRTSRAFCPNEHFCLGFQTLNLSNFYHSFLVLFDNKKLSQAHTEKEKSAWCVRIYTLPFTQHVDAFAWPAGLALARSRTSMRALLVCVFPHTHTQFAFAAAPIVFAQAATEKETDIGFGSSHNHTQTLCANSVDDGFNFLYYDNDECGAKKNSLLKHFDQTHVVCSLDYDNNDWRMCVCTQQQQHRIVRRTRNEQITRTYNYYYTILDCVCANQSKDTTANTQTHTGQRANAVRWFPCCYFAQRAKKGFSFFCAFRLLRLIWCQRSFTWRVHAHTHVTFD